MQPFYYSCLGRERIQILYPNPPILDKFPTLQLRSKKVYFVKDHCEIKNKITIVKSFFKWITDQFCIPHQANDHSNKFLLRSMLHVTPFSPVCVYMFSQSKIVINQQQKNSQHFLLSSYLTVR